MVTDSRLFLHAVNVADTGSTEIRISPISGIEFHVQLAD